MTRPDETDPRARAAEPVRFAGLPIDPDLDASDDAGHRPHHQRPDVVPTRWPRFRLPVLVAVFVGGCLGGYTRYAVTQAWTAARYGVPWSTFAVNVAGAFILALVVVVASQVRPTRYVRPLLGTGFCGALTTFSSVVVATAELFAHGHEAAAAGYLVLTTVAALAAAWIGLVCGRRLPPSPRTPERFE